MTQQQISLDPEAAEEQREIKQRLMRRVGIAVALIGGTALTFTLLEKLDLTDLFKPSLPLKTIEQIPPSKPIQAAPPPPPHDKPVEDAATPPATATGPETSPDVAPAKEPAQTTTAPSVEAPQSIQKINAEPPAEAASPMATPNTTPSPPKASPPPPNVETQPTTTHHQRLPPKLATKPAEPALHQPSISSAPPSEQRSSNEPTRPIAPVVTPPRQTASTEAPAAPIITKPKPVNAQAFSVQVGIFANYDNAKTLVERLSANGVNAHIESRVQVGPFKNKAEADDTMRKLKAMGIQSVLVPLASSTAAQ